MSKLAAAMRQGMQDQTVVDVMEKRNQLIVFHGPDVLLDLPAKRARMLESMVNLLKK